MLSDLFVSAEMRGVKDVDYVQDIHKKYRISISISKLIYRVKTSDPKL